MCECCVLSGRGLCTGLITHPAESYRLCCVVVCDRESSILRRPWPTGGLLRHGREEDEKKEKEKKEEEKEEEEEDGARRQHYNSHLVYLVQQLHQNYSLHSADMT